MKVPLRELPDQRAFALDGAYMAELLEKLPMREALGEDAGEAGAAKADLDFYIEGENVFGRGKLEGWVELACSRCLQATRQEIAEDLMLSFLPAGSLPAEDDEELTEDEDEDPSQSEDTYGYEGDAIDVEPALRERALLSLPFAPLCKEDCLGLCSQCGKNLNDSECGCDRKVIDPRLAALRDIKV